MHHSAANRLKADGLYTQYYCEENIYNLLKLLNRDHGLSLQESLVLFISNLEKKIPLWHQAVSEREDGFVVWDYHVILIDVGASQVWDLDTRLDIPCSLETYIRNAIKPDIDLPDYLRRLKLFLSEA